MENKNKTQCRTCNTLISNSGFHNHTRYCIGEYKPYRPMGKKCKFCEIEIPDTVNIGNHVRWCEKNPKVSVVSKKHKQLHGVLKNCKNCGKEFLNFNRRTLCSDCKVMSDETRKKISEGRSRYLQENPDLHPWKNPNKSESVPCNNVKKYLIERNIDFVEELSPMESRAFSIDIAFPQLKIGIEINGNQHYNRDGTLKPYYQERHNLIESVGWKLIEVHYTECFSDQSIGKFLNFEIPRDNTKIIEYFKNKQDRELATDKLLPIETQPRTKIKDTRKRIKSGTLPRGQKIKNKTDTKWIPIKDTIFDYEIDFSKFGWVSKVAQVLTIPPQKVSKWMIRYHPEFYENSCFKRSD